MSKEYIERELALSIIDDYVESLGYSPNHSMPHHALKGLSAADVKPVRHGRWLDMDTLDAHRQPIYQCSECRKEVADYYIDKHKFCLHCGTKMDKE